jgi:hypothetical protein
VQDAATGISLRVANAYADVTSTVVQMQTSNTAGYPLDIWKPLLTLQSGRSLQYAGGYSSASASASVSFMICEPVPPADFGP